MQAQLDSAEQESRGIRAAFGIEQTCAWRRSGCFGIESFDLCQGLVSAARYDAPRRRDAPWAGCGWCLPLCRWTRSAVGPEVYPENAVGP